MKFISTRSADTQVSLSDAITQGLAPDGGLFIPSELPRLPLRVFDTRPTLAETAAALLRPFADGDPLEADLDGICREAFNFPAPLAPLPNAPGPVSVLELFHGPTCAFKDFGARFVAACLQRLRSGMPHKLTIVVATSGDTGGAVAAAFHGRAFADVVLLYPKGLVSPRQAQQLSCWGGNVRTFAVRGTFDDCQRMAKEAFRDAELARSFELSSANSINLGRLLPQAAYYAWASLQIWNGERRKPNVIVPTGNLGNAMACVLAREMGLPIGDIVLVTNANLTITDYVNEGVWRPRPSVATLASAMDVGNPSNMERLRALLPDLDRLRLHISAEHVSDDEIRTTIREDWERYGRAWCPHTATAAWVYRDIARTRADEHWVIVATAHPAKFNEIVEPLIGEAIPVPAALERLLRLPRQESELDASVDGLKLELLRHL